jgi:hypothetical protein
MKSLWGLAIFIADIIAVVDCIRSNKDTGKKILWIILILILPVLGLLLYYFIGRKQ